MKKKIIPVFCIALLMASFVYAHAADEAAQEITLYVGQIKVFATDVPRRIAIGKPEVADVTTVTDSEITLAAKAMGATTFAYWDNAGEQVFNVKVFSEDIPGIKQRAEDLIKELNLPKVYAKAAESENKVLLLGEVKSAQDRERIFTALGTLRDKIVDLIKIREEEAAVEIEVEIVEVDEDATETLGLTNPLTTTSGITLTEVGSPGILTAGTKWSTLFKVLNLKHDAFTWTLYALAQQGKARILSQPRLACQSGKEAELLVGGEKPTFTTQVASTTGATGTEIEYKEFGIKLKVKPTVTEERKIKLALNVEVSEVGSAEFIGLTSNRTAQAYPLTKRNASTELLLNDGQTMAIGGLIKQKSEEDISKTPGLGDIPILGALFRKRTTKTGGGSGERGNVELFIMLTPTIVPKESPEKEAEVTKKEAQPEEKDLAVSLPKEAPLKEAAPTEKPPAKENPPLKIQIAPGLVDYVRLVQAKIAKAISYPQPAKDAGWQGNVRLSLNISSNGDLKDARIAQSSGYGILDDAAAQVARKQAPYPPFPPQIASQELWIDVLIVYREN